MILILNLKILVGLGRFLALGRYVLQNHFVRYITAACCKVPPGPQMSAPKLPAQVRELHQQFVTGLALEVLHHFAHRQIGRHRHKQMDMVFTHMPFNYLYVIGSADLSHQFAHPRPNRPAQHRPETGQTNSNVEDSVARDRCNPSTRTNTCRPFRP